jgi:hypothetical protein
MALFVSSMFEDHGGSGEQMLQMLRKGGLRGKAVIRLNISSSQ